MLTTDFPIFEEVIRRLEKIFAKEIDDGTMQGYWGALKDQPLAVFRRLAEHHTRNGKFFPKPFELRPKEERGVVRDAAGDATFQEGEARCIRNLEDLRVREPDGWLKEVQLRKLDRLIAITHPGVPGYQQLLNDWRDARGIHVGDKERAEARDEQR